MIDSYYVVLVYILTFIKNKGIDMNGCAKNIQWLSELPSDKIRDSEIGVLAYRKDQVKDIQNHLFIKARTLYGIECYELILYKHYRK